jgi:hypothetical protein
MPGNRQHPASPTLTSCLRPSACWPPPIPTTRFRPDRKSGRALITVRYPVAVAATCHIRSGRHGSARSAFGRRSELVVLRSAWPGRDTQLLDRVGRGFGWLGYYRVQSAWVGGRRAARRAGSKPARAPMMMAAASPPTQASGGMTVAQPLAWGRWRWRPHLRRLRRCHRRRRAEWLRTGTGCGCGLWRRRSRLRRRPLRSLRRAMSSGARRGLPDQAIGEKERQGWTQRRS